MKTKKKGQPNTRGPDNYKRLCRPTFYGQILIRLHCSKMSQIEIKWERAILGPFIVAQAAHLVLCRLKRISFSNLDLFTRSWQATNNWKLPMPIIRCQSTFKPLLVNESPQSCCYRHRAGRSDKLFQIHRRRKWGGATGAIAPPIFWLGGRESCICPPQYLAPYFLKYHTLSYFSRNSWNFRGLRPLGPHNCLNWHFWHVSAVCADRKRSVSPPQCSRSSYAYANVLILLKKCNMTLVMSSFCHCNSPLPIDLNCCYMYCYKISLDYCQS